MPSAAPRCVAALELSPVDGDHHDRAPHGFQLGDVFAGLGLGSGRAADLNPAACDHGVNTPARQRAELLSGEQFDAAVPGSGDDRPA
jgi:hypothetical protein